MATKKTASSGSGILAPIENFYMPIISAVPFARLKTWASAYFHPVETFQKNKSDSNWGAIAVHLVLIGLLYWVALLLESIIGLNFILFGATLVMVIALVIGIPIAGVVGSIIYYVVAKLLGGKGSFTNQTLALTLVFGGLITVGFPLIALSNVLLVGWIFGLLYMLAGLYGLYNMYLVVKDVHSLSSGKAIVVVLVPIVLTFLVAFLVAGALALAYAGMAGAAGTVPRPYGY